MSILTPPPPPAQDPDIQAFIAAIYTSIENSLERLPYDASRKSYICLRLAVSMLDCARFELAEDIIVTRA